MEKKGKIGIFDSGLGGLLIAKSIRKVLPQYEYTYLGDTKRVPYGNRPHKEVTKYTLEAVKYLLIKENCQLIVVACNTASARALRNIQQGYLKKYFPDRRVLGVLIPGAEEAALSNRVGVIATEGTVLSKSFPIEIKKINKKAKVFQNKAPMLVPLIEEGDNKNATKYAKVYLKPFLDKRIQTLVLGCTHYPIIKKEIKKIVGKKIKIISQDEIVPKKLKIYLRKHSELTKKLSSKRKINILVTKKTSNMSKLIGKWFGRNQKPKLISLS